MINEKFKLKDEQLEVIYGGEFIIEPEPIKCGVNCFCAEKKSLSKNNCNSPHVHIVSK